MREFYRLCCGIFGFSALSSRREKSAYKAGPCKTSEQGPALLRVLVLAAVGVITFLIKKLALLRYELTYKTHVKVRKFHDVLVVKSPSYKKVSEHQLARPIRNATVTAFFASLLLFTTIQFVMPYFNIFKPSQVQAAANSKTWTTRGDFNNGTTKTDTVVSGAQDSDDASATLNHTKMPGKFPADPPTTGYTTYTLVYGGGGIFYGFQDINSAVFRQYSSVTNTWTNKASLPAATASQGASLVYTGGDYIYAFRGYNLSNFYRYTISTNTWASMLSCNKIGGTYNTLAYPGSGNYIYLLTSGSAVATRYSISGNSWGYVAAPPLIGTNTSMAYPGSGEYLYALQGGGTGFIRYSTTLDQWSTMAPVPGITSSGASLIGTNSDYMYALQGGSASKNFYRYSILNDSWSSMQKIPNFLTTGSSLAYPGGDYIYAIIKEYNTSNTYAWRYSISENSWGIKAPTSSTASTVKGNGDLIYSLGGGTSFYSYNVKQNIWATLSNTPGTVGTYADLVYDGNNYIYATRGSTFADFYRYDIAANQWSAMTSAPALLQLGSGLAYPGSGDYIYLTRGSSGTFYRYTISTDVWAGLASSPGSSQMAGTLVGTTGYIFQLPAQNSTLLYRYTIADGTWAQMTSAPLYFDASGKSGLVWDGNDTLYGNTGLSSDGNFFAYSILANTWSTKAVPPHKGTGADLAASSFGNFIYAFLPNTDHVFTYNITSNSWGGSILPSYTATTGLIEGLTADVGPGSKVSWKDISWKTDFLQTNNSVVMKARSSDDNINWSAWSVDFTQSGLASSTGAGDLNALNWRTRYLQIAVTLNGDSLTSAPTLLEVTANYDYLNTPSSLVQYKTDDSTQITNNWTSESSFIAKADLGVPLATRSPLTPQFEVRTADAGWTGNADTNGVANSFGITSTANNTTYTCSADPCAALGVKTIGTISGFTEGTSYYYRTRTTDTAGHVSLWSATSSVVNVEQTPPSGSVTINSSAQYSPSVDVTLNVSATDNGSFQSSPNPADLQMQFSNDGTTWSGWEAYAATKAWSITAGDGTKTVYAQFKDNAGNIVGNKSLINNGFESGTDGVPLGSPWSLFGVPQNAEYDTLRAKNGTMSAWIQGPTTSTYGGASESATAGMNVDGSEQTFWVYFDNATGRRFIEDNNATDTSKVFTLYFTSTGGVQIYTSRTATGYVANSYTPVGTYAAGWMQYKIAYDFANKNYTLGRRAAIGDVWTYLKAAGAPDDNIPFRTTNVTNTTSGLVFKGHAYSQMWLDDLQYGLDIKDTIILDTAPPSPPSSGLTVSPAVIRNQNVTVSWSAATDGSGIKEYKVYRKKDSGTYDYLATVTSPTLTYTDTSLALSNVANQGLYYYKVLAVDTPGNEGPQSADFPVLIVDYTGPDAPSTLTVNPTGWTNTTFTFSVTATDPQINTQSASSIAKFHYRADAAPDATTEDGFIAITPANPGTGSITNFAETHDGTHTMYVTAEDALGNVNWANSTIVEYKYDATPPTPVTGLGATKTDTNKIQVSWTLKSDSASPMQNYKLERVKDTGNQYLINGAWAGQTGYAIFTLTDTDMPFDDTPGVVVQGQSAIDASTQYQYRISVKDSVNASYSNYQALKVYGMTDDLRAPDPISVIGASACDGTLNLIPGSTIPKCSDIARKGSEITVVWNPGSDFGSGIAGYKVYRSVTGAVGSYVSVGTTSAIVNFYHDNDTTNPIDANKLNDYTTYYYRITAVDASSHANESDLHSVGNPFINASADSTPDVTAPTVPIGVSVTPMGLDTSNPDTNTPISGATGTVSSATINTLTDSGKSWTPDKYKNLTVAITSGTGSGQTRSITSHTGSIITVSANWAVTPDGTSQYEIYQGHQRMQITWSASNDFKHYADTNSDCSGSSNVPENNNCGSRVKTYRIYRDTSSSGSFVTLVGTVTNPAELTINEDSLADFTYYYYRVEAGDNATPENTSARSTQVGGRSASSAVPTTPTNVTVNSTKGNPADTNVGHKVVVTFQGSYAKYCLNGVRCIVSYEVYRSTTNLATPAEWLALTPIAIIPPNVPDDDRDSTYTVNDTGLTGSTTYYYKVRAIDNTPPEMLNGSPIPNTGPFQSSLTAITYPGTLYAGWDITPDVTEPTIPVGGLEVKVRDTHPNLTELRNIITWKMMTDAQQPTRNGVNDFARYEVHREVVHPITGDVISDTNVGNVVNNSDNYLVDIIPIAFAELKYKYYVVIVDNADTAYTYSNGTVINAYANVSAREYWTESIIPAKAKPILSGPVTLSNVGVSSAVVSWTTDQDADSLVQFRTKGSSDNWVAIGQIERSTSHTVNLFGLKPTTEYEYQLVSRNYLGNNVEYDAANLPTLTTNGFTITYQPDKLDVSTVSATVYWTTNMPSNTNMVEYKENNGSATLSAAEPPLTLSSIPTSDQNCTATPRLCEHSVSISPLKKNTDYTFRIIAMSLDNYNTSSGLISMRTSNSDARQFTVTPSASNVAERNITATSAQIVFQTAEPTTAVLYYDVKSGAPGYDTKSYKMTATDSSFGTTHVIMVDGLEPGVKYYYVVSVSNGLLTYTSPESSFTAVLKPKISNMTVKNISSYAVTIAWDTNIETETVINWGTTAAYGEKRGKSGVSKVHELTMDNLLDNQEYHYQILAKDGLGNEVADTDKIVRTPLDTEGPKISAVKIDVLPMSEADSTASVIVSWLTNKPSTTLVEYDEGVIGGAYNQSSVQDTTLNTSHTVIIKGLKPASSYHYRLVSADKRENKTVSQDYTFVTPSKEKSILQLILKSLEETFAWTRNLNQFFGNIGKRLTGN